MVREYRMIYKISVIHVILSFFLKIAFIFKSGFPTTILAWSSATENKYTDKMKKKRTKLGKI
jgi:hypothetical protein